MKTAPKFNGVLNIDKPAGMTSHDVVDAIRRSAGERQVGHTGTLDPMATGVLPICIGRATKIQQFLIAQDKEYSIEMRLGVVTDTQDTTGQILEENEVPSFTQDEVVSVLNRFLGELEQIPPMVSAKHHKGKRLYELARKGVEVKRDPCKIFIHQLILDEISLPAVRFHVTCGKGTYIRTLCHDIGQSLGTGAAMSGLVRVRCGAFHVDNAAPLDALQTPGDIEKHLCSMNDALSSMPSVTVGSEGIASFRCGRFLSGGLISRCNEPFESGSMIRVASRDGSLVGIGESLMSSDQLDALAGNLRVIKPVKVFQN
ncbi:MAG: tRNA pseudouridine(55) synthase TruB [Candidatus Omnitrophica bacterium]|nr:tRNA pseudouridine(55) synthase TruB [Candidatus Omnitrophota bacterium]